MTPYNIKVKHIPADKNMFAHALSRLPSKSDTTPPTYIERYTKIQIKPHPQQAKIRSSEPEGMNLWISPQQSLYKQLQKIQSTKI